MRKIILLGILSLIATLVMGGEVNQDQKKVLKKMGFNELPKKGGTAAAVEEKELKVLCGSGFGDSGASLLGPTGYIMVPTQKILPRNSGSAGMHIYYPSNQGSERLAKYLKFNFACHEKVEINATKVYTTLSGMSDLDPYFTLKYKAFPEVVLAATLDASSLNDDIRYKNSFYALWGRDFEKYTLTLGGGINTGKSNAFSHFGDADSNDSKKGFILAATSVKLAENLNFMMDYNGDLCSFGIRYSNGGLNFDIQTVQKGDNLALLPASGNQKTVFGISLNF
ncbi:MAG: hypothetical protein PHQ23_07225 [Candidatus Wallbacteria bacterium]|nr:hypothetical protein [Candidatus Wallbacteria bacterium]